MAAGQRAGSRAGWPSSPQIEALRSEWLRTPNPQAQHRLIAAIQMQAFKDLPYVPMICVVDARQTCPGALIPLR